MALTILFSQMFADKFLVEYQGRGQLRDTVMQRHGLRGDAFKGRVVEAVAMDERGLPLSDIASKQPDYRVPITAFSNWVNKLSSDQMEQLDINSDVLSSFPMTHAKAIGRREDQLIIDALEAGATKEVPVGTTNLTIDKLIAAKKLLNDDEVDGELHIVISASQLDSLLNENQIQSSDYNTIRALVAGELDTYMGYKFHTIGDRSEGGLPLATTTRSVFVYAKDAVELSYRKDPMVQVTDVPEHLRVETLSSFSAGSVVNRPKGVVKILCDEA